MIDKKKIFFGVGALVLVVAVFAGGILIGKNFAVVRVSAPADADFSLFWDAYNSLHQHYIDKNNIDEKKLIYGAIAGMTHSLGDPYTSFFDPAEAKLFESDLAGSFSGVGIEVGTKQGRLTIIAPLKGTPSDRAGLKSGDQIVKIEGKSTSDISSDQAVDLIRGKKGTTVTLTIFREGWNEVKDFKITRDTINIPSVDWEIKNGDVVYVHIYQFDQTLSANFANIAQHILQSTAKKIILDLRGNPGGYLEVSQDVAGWFLAKGQLVTIEDFGTGKTRQEFKTQGSGALAHYPLVVLIDKGSASAAEILAGALRDNRNVKLIGEKSFGKGSVQEISDLKDGASFLKITIAKWLTPKGNSISQVGLTPDVSVGISDSDLVDKKDPQLDKALEIIQGLK